MLIKYKLGDVAKDFGKQNKELIGILSRYFEGEKKHSTNLTEEELNFLFDYLTKQAAVDSLDSFFAEAEKKYAKVKEEREKKEKELSLIHIL